MTVSVLQIANGGTLSQGLTTTATTNSRITFTIVGYSGNEYINVSFSGSNTFLDATSTNFQGNGTYTTVLSNGGKVIFTPTADFSGEVTNVSVKPITSPSAVLQLNNTDSSDGFEFRPGGINLDNTFIGISAGGSNTTVPGIRPSVGRLALKHHRL